MITIENKVIVITGGNGLLGREMINSFRSNGAKVISFDIFHDKKGEFDYIVDISKKSSVINGVNKILKKFDRIDGWVNNAYPRTQDWGKKIEDIEIDSWRKNIDMHLNGYFICSQVVLELMKLKRKGSLVNMSSIYGSLGPDFSIYKGTEITSPAAYSAIKGGINNLTRYLASYYGDSQIRVNSVSPGGIFDNQSELFVQNYTNKVPLKRMANPQDIVSAIYFLLSDQSSYITGHNLVVDGGWSII